MAQPKAGRIRSEARSSVDVSAHMSPVAAFWALQWWERRVSSAASEAKHAEVTDPKKPPTGVRGGAGCEPDVALCRVTSVISKCSLQRYSHLFFFFYVRWRSFHPDF